MLNVGLTGSIACGKSTVARMLQKRGAHIIDFDTLAHYVEEPEHPAWQEIVAFFGREVLAADGQIDREKLGAIVFADKDKLARLNEIVHPAVFEEWSRRISEIEKNEPRAIIISDIPLLIEVGMESLVDLVVLVYATPEEQIDRLMGRNGFSRAEAETRLSAQMPIAEKLKHAHIVVNNEESLEKTEHVVGKLWEELVRREREKAVSVE
ncbi:MAG: dephospho-CoA kinase [Smithellaceae bacterium]|nr:dephospho-CoA kinase [Smithellaceae bacterium]